MKTNNIVSNRRVLGRFLTGSILVTLILIFSTVVSYAQDVRVEVNQALTSGDTTLAINLLKKGIETDKTYSLNYVLLGRIYFNREQFAAAKEQFQIALSKKSRDFDAMYYLGLAHLALGEFTEAQKLMDDGRKKAPKDQKGRFEDGYGQAMMAMGDSQQGAGSKQKADTSYREADRAFRMALEAEPNNASYHIHLGNANFKEGIPSLAADEYQKALQSDTGSTEVYYNWAEACLGMKDYQCAMEKLRVVLTKDSTFASAWMRAGGIYFKAALSTTNREDRANRLRDAVGSYRRYLDLTKAQPDSSSARAYFELAMCYLNLNGFEDAAANFEKVLSIPVEPRDIYFNYGKALWGIKQYEKASEMFLKHIEWVQKQPSTYTSQISDAELYMYLGDSYYYRKPNDFTNAITYYKKSLETDSAQKRVLYNVAVAYHTLKSYFQAIEYYDRRAALGVDSANSSIYKNAGYCALSIAGGKGQDETDLQNVSSGDATASVDSTKPAVDPNKNWNQVAVDYLEKYLQYNPKDVKALGLIGNTYLYQLKDCANGVKAYERVLAIDPNDCNARRSMGYAYFAKVEGEKAGSGCGINYSKALTYLLEAYNCQSKGGNGCSDLDLVLWIAQAYHMRAAEKGADRAASKADFKSAFEWYGKVLKCDPGNKAAKEGQDNTRYEFSN